MNGLPHGRTMNVCQSAVNTKIDGHSNFNGNGGLKGVCSAQVSGMSCENCVACDLHQIYYL